MEMRGSMLPTVMNTVIYRSPLRVSPTGRRGLSTGPLSAGLLQDFSMFAPINREDPRPLLSTTRYDPVSASEHQIQFLFLNKKNIFNLKPTLPNPNKVHRRVFNMSLTWGMLKILFD